MNDTSLNNSFYTGKRGPYNLYLSVEANPTQESLDRRLHESVETFHTAMNNRLNDGLLQNLKMTNEEVRQDLSRYIGGILSVEIQDKGECMSLLRDQNTAKIPGVVVISEEAERQRAQLVDLVNICWELEAIIKKSPLTPDIEMALGAFWATDRQSKDLPEINSLMQEYRSHVEQLGLPMDVPFEKALSLEDVFEGQISSEIAFHVYRKKFLVRALKSFFTPRFTAMASVLLLIVVSLLLMPRPPADDPDRQEEQQKKEKSFQKDIDNGFDEVVMPLKAKRYYKQVNTDLKDSYIITPVITKLPYQDFNPPLVVMNPVIAQLFQEVTEKKIIEWRHFPSFFYERIMAFRGALGEPQFKIKKDHNWLFAQDKDGKDLFIDIRFSEEAPAKKTTKSIRAFQLFHDVYSVTYSFRDIGQVQCWIDLRSGKLIYWDGNSVNSESFHADGSTIENTTDQLVKLLVDMTAAVRQPYEELMGGKNPKETLKLKKYPHVLLPDFYEGEVRGPFTTNGKRVPEPLTNKVRRVSSPALLDDTHPNFMYVSRNGNGEFTSRVFIQDGIKALYPALISSSPKDIQTSSYLSLAQLAEKIQNIRSAHVRGEGFQVDRQSEACLKMSHPKHGMFLVSSEDAGNGLSFQLAYVFEDSKDRIDLFFQHSSGIRIPLIIAPNDKGKVSFYAFDGEKIVSKDVAAVFGFHVPGTLGGRFVVNRKRVVRDASAFVAPLVATRLGDAVVKKFLEEEVSQSKK